MRCRFPALTGLLVLSATCATGCGDASNATQNDDDAASDARTVDPAAFGPYSVGFTDRTVVLPDGEETGVQIWYPARTIEGSSPDAYPFLPMTREGHEDAPAVVPDDGVARPLIVFSHGLSSTRLQSVYLMEHLASHGWVIAAPDHPGTRFWDADLFGDLANKAVERPGAIFATADLMFDGATTDDAVLEGLVDESLGYVAMGHSFGAFTMLSVVGARFDAPAAADHCREDPEGYTGCDFLTPEELDLLDPGDTVTYDPRAVAYVGLSPGLGWAFHEDSLQDLPPVLMMGGTFDDVLGYDEEIVPTFALVGDDKVLATHRRAGHYGYSDLCVLGSLDSLGLQDCDTDNGWQPIENVQASSAEAVTAWLGQRIAGDAGLAAWSFDAWAEPNLLDVDYE